jgi:hypothetical protein
MIGVGDERKDAGEKKCMQNVVVVVVHVNGVRLCL